MSIHPDYRQFLDRKRVVDPMTGLTAVPPLPEAMFGFQRDITSWSLRRGRAALFAGTGLGKTLMELTWADRVAAHTGKPVLIFAPLAVSQQHIREAGKFGLSARIVRDQSEVGPGINVTNYQKIEHFDLPAFGGVVLDECFAPDTPIDVINQDGSVSQKHIENIRPGDHILNASGVDVVSDVHRREVPYAIRVRYAGKSIICSPNHPFFTRSGWKGAVDLIPGDEIMATSEAVRMVRQDVFAEKLSRGEEQVLRSILLSEMADAPAGSFSKGPFAGSGSEARAKEKRVDSQRRSKGRRRTGTHYCAQPNVYAGGSRESLPPIEVHEARTFRAWGERARFDSAAVGFDGCAARQLEGGICFVTGTTDSRLSHALQDRLGRYREANSYRGGWSLTPFSRRIGPEEGPEARGFRVEGIEVLECGNPELDRYRNAEGKLYFYDLGGTRHPSFSIHGALVHNSSVLKSTDGKYRTRLISECSTVPFRLAATATPAPNDFMELGNHAEFLGVMSYTDMLATFFVHDGGDTQKWRLKGHAENEFWKWMASWAVMLRQPSDLGYPNDGYDLPPLRQQSHTVAVDYEPSLDTGLLFPMEARTMQERLAARRDSIEERVALAASITPADRPFVWWCHLNPEAEQLAKAIPGAVNLTGSDSDDDKERKLIDFSEQRTRVLITKPSIAGFGMNWQHCADTGFVGLNDSFEQIYQAIRRFWRFGQTKPVNVHFIASEMEGAVVVNLRRKEADADHMADQMVAHMADLTSELVRGNTRVQSTYNPTLPMSLPAWLTQEDAA